MDLPLWDSSAYDYESKCSAEDYSLGNFSFGCGRDALEEDALNEKSCLQVLKIWIDKADEEILKLEDDKLMLKCQLALDDEDWSKQCFAALREKIDHLDILIQNLKNDDREDGHHLETEELPPRIHDLLKTLLENYLANRKQSNLPHLLADSSLPLNDEQTETSMIQMPVPPAVELGNKKSEASNSNGNKKMNENACTTVLKTYERKSKCTELEGRKINHPLQKTDAVTTEFNASAHTCSHDEVSENFRSKPNTPVGRIMPNLVHVKSEPADPMVKESTASMSIEKANSREREEKRNNDNKAISKAKSIQVGIVHEVEVITSRLKLQKPGSQISEIVEVDRRKQITEAPSKVQKARVNRCITEKAVEALNTEMKNSPGTMNFRTEHVINPIIKLAPQIQMEQRCGFATAVISQAKSISPSKAEGQGPQKKCKSSPEMLQNPFMAEHIEKGLSSTENLTRQNKKKGVAERMSKKGTQQKLNENNIAGASEGNATPILLLQEVSQLSFSSQTTGEEGQSSVMNVVKKEAASGVMNVVKKETACGVTNGPGIPSLCIQDKEKLTVKELKAIAKSRNFLGYSKLKKEELQRLLDL